MDTQTSPRVHNLPSCMLPGRLLVLVLACNLHFFDILSLWWMLWSVASSDLWEDGGRGLFQHELYAPTT